MNDVNTLEVTIKEAKKKIAKRNCLERLTKNKDFKTVVLEGFFEQEAIRLVHAKASPVCDSPESQASILSQIDAIGNFRAYLGLIMQEGNMAERAVGQHEEELERALEEDL